MGNEIDLLKHYPKTKRDISQRGAEKTEEDRIVARKFGKEFFDGERRHGYGGFSYSPKFWKPVVPDFKEYYGLTKESSILDIGCAKGFMLNDFIEEIPGINARGVDISNYAIQHCKESVKNLVDVGDARALPFEDNAFDLVISINTIHNLDTEELKTSLKEISRVSRKHSFITVDAYRNHAEKGGYVCMEFDRKNYPFSRRLVSPFKEVGFEGDYFWFVP